MTSEATKIPRLFHDILFEVFGHLFGPDEYSSKQDFCQAMLVCRDWAAVGQQVLYTEIAVICWDIQLSELRGQHFIAEDTLTRLVGTGGESTDRPMMRKDAVDLLDRTLEERKDLSQIITRATFLFGRWTCQRYGFSRTLRDLFPALRELRLSSVHILHADLLHIPLLEVLRMKNCTIRTDWDNAHQGSCLGKNPFDQSDFRLKFPHLNTLEVVGSPMETCRTALHLLRSSRAGTLTDLSLINLSTANQHLNLVVDHIRPHITYLQSLNLAYPGAWYTAQAQIPTDFASLCKILPSATNLQTMEMCHPAWQPNLRQFIESLPSSITNLRITSPGQHSSLFIDKILHGDNEGASPFAQVLWERLSLKSELGLPRLKRITFGYSVKFLHEPTPTFKDDEDAVAMSEWYRNNVFEQHPEFAEMLIARKIDGQVVL